MKVLIADDDPVCCRLLEATLQKSGFDVIAARDGDEAASLAREYVPDLVITDIVMPGMDGYELCRRLKTERVLDGAPVILLTALSDPRDVIRALQCRADGFVTKPFDKAFLLRYIQDLTTGHGNRAAEKDDGSIELTYGGETYTLEPDVKQATSLLLSTYDNALQKNLELQAANRALVLAEEELRAANEDLTRKQKQIDRDLEAAAGIQRSLLPREAPDTPAMEVRWRFRPCEKIGGDIFDVVRLDPCHYAMFMIDVSGHGVPSALVTVSVSHTLQPDSGVLVRREGRGLTGWRIASPREVMEALEAEYPMERFEKFFTIAYVVIDIHTGTLRYSCAGHPAPLLQRAGGEIELLECGGPMIGLGVDLPYEESTVSLGPGDRFVLYTDGVVEHQNTAGELYGTDRLVEAVRRRARDSLDVMLDGLMDDLTDFNASSPTDDVSLLGMTFKG